MLVLSELQLAWQFRPAPRDSRPDFPTVISQQKVQQDLTGELPSPPSSGRTRDPMRSADNMVVQLRVWTGKSALQSHTQ